MGGEEQEDIKPKIEDRKTVPVFPTARALRPITIDRDDSSYFVVEASQIDRYISIKISQDKDKQIANACYQSLIAIGCSVATDMSLIG